MLSFRLLPLLRRYPPRLASSNREAGAAEPFPTPSAAARPDAREAPGLPPRGVLEARARLNRRSVPAEIRAAYATPPAELERAARAGGAPAADSFYLSACSTSADRTLSESK